MRKERGPPGLRVRKRRAFPASNESAFDRQRNSLIGEGRHRRAVWARLGFCSTLAQHAGRDVPALQVNGPR